MKLLLELLNELKENLYSIKDKQALNDALVWYEDMPKDISMWKLFFKIDEFSYDSWANATNEEIEKMCINHIANIENKEFNGKIIFEETINNGNYHFDIINCENDKIVFSKDIDTEYIENNLSYCCEVTDEFGNVKEYSIKRTGDYFFQLVLNCKSKYILDNSLYEKSFVFKNGNRNPKRIIKITIDENSLETDLNLEKFSNRELIKHTSIINGLVQSIELKKYIRLEGQPDKVVLEKIVVDKNRNFVKTKNKQFVTHFQD